MRILPAIACAAAWVLLFNTEARAQASQIDQVLQQLEQVHYLSEVSISPDGRWIAWNEPAPNGGSGTVIYLLDWKNPSAKPKRVSAENGKKFFWEGRVAWSPDSGQIAFFSNAGSTQEQIFVWRVTANKAQRVTNVTGYVADIRWSPNGRQIAFLYAEHGGGGGPLEAVPAQTGAIGSDIHNQRLTIVNASGGDIRQVSPADLNIYEYDWSPDGNRFAALAAPGPADNNWWTAQLYLLGLNSGRMDVLYHPPVERQLAVPRWSPDGKQIAFIGGLMSDEGFIGGDIYAIPSQGGEPRDLTPDRKASPSGFSWQSSEKIVFTESRDGGSDISTLDVAGGETEMLWKGDEGIHQDGNYPNFSLARDGKTSAVVRASWQQPPEVWGGPVGDWRQLTHANTAQRPHWGKAESITWNSSGFRVQGWLLYPENFDPGKRYPMVVEIHGGPAGERAASWPSAHFDMSVMAGLGYFVFFPNPRGSYGEGEAFTRANVKDFGGGDLRDILAGVDTVLTKVPVDNARIGVTGWSYGGFMTMWTVTQTNRFKAAVAGAGIADWLSYYGENSIDEWMIPYFGASVYDNPEVYAKSSPITYIKRVKTPTLVVVGERDGECPAPQSFEFWHALKALHVPTHLVVYAGEGHSFADPRSRVDVLRRTLAWFNQYLTPGAQ
ncbi:MAG: S9 family peptidase [Bryobacteraceae bacterium]